MKKTRKQLDFERRERDILDAFLDLVEEGGGADVSLDRVAERVGVARGTVYLHFATKDELLARLVLDFHERVLADLARLDDEPDVGTRFRETVGLYIRHHVEARPGLRLVLGSSENASFLARLRPETRARYAEANRAYMRRVEGWVVEGIASGLFTAGPVQVRLWGPTATLMGVVRMFWSGWVPEGGPDAVIRELTDYILSGLRRGDASPGRGRAVRQSSTG